MPKPKTCGIITVQRYLGLMWITKLLYPEKADYDLYEDAAEYYRLFCHIELTKEQYDELVANSIGKMYYRAS